MDRKLKERAEFNRKFNKYTKISLGIVASTVLIIAATQFNGSDKVKSADLGNYRQPQSKVIGAVVESETTDTESPVAIKLVDEQSAQISMTSTVSLDKPKYTHTYAKDREDKINSKKAAFVRSKNLQSRNVYCVEPKYNDDGKMVISSRAEAMCLDIREVSNWTADDYYKILNKELYELVPTAIRMEKELGVNSIYIIAVGANETGWGKCMAGRYNFFNWTHDGKNHFNFDSIEAFTDSSIQRYSDYYLSESDFEHSAGFLPSCVTPEVVNTKYATLSNNTPNWEWSNTVSEIMSMLSTRLYK